MEMTEILTLVFNVINSTAVLAIVLTTAWSWGRIRARMDAVHEYLKVTNQGINLAQMMNVERMYRDALREERYEDARNLKSVLAILEKDLREMTGQTDELDERQKEAMREIIERFARERKGGGK